MLATYTIVPAGEEEKSLDGVPPNLGGGKHLRHFKWSPVGNALVYVDHNRNIRYRLKMPSGCF